MSDLVEIISAEGNSKLVLTDPLFNEQGNLDYFSLTFDLPGMKAETKVYAYAPHGDVLKEFFEDIAQNWKGFEGTKQYSSLEGELKIDATSDTSGHTYLKIDLRSNKQDWQVRGDFVLVAGQLDTIVKDLQSFFAGSATS